MILEITQEDYAEYISDMIKEIYGYVSEEIYAIENIKDRLLKIQMFQYLITFLIVIALSASFIMFLYLIHRINKNKIEILKLKKELNNKSEDKNNV